MTTATPFGNVAIKCHSTFCVIDTVDASGATIKHCFCVYDRQTADTLVARLAAGDEGAAYYVGLQR